MARGLVWSATSAVAIVAGAWWLRSPHLRYLVLAGIATLATLAVSTMASAPDHSRIRRWALAVGAALGAFDVVAGFAQYDLTRVERSWPAYRAALVLRAERILGHELDTAIARLRTTAQNAVAAPAEPRLAFAALRALAGPAGPGIVVYRDTVPTAWAGRTYTLPQWLGAPVSAVATPFYVTLQAEVEQGRQRAVATVVVHAEPPADGLTDAIAERTARRVGVSGFQILVPDRVPAPAAGRLPVLSAAERGDTMLYAPLGDTLFRVHPVPPTQAEARMAALRRARTTGGLLLAVALILYIAALWRRQTSVWWRLGPLAVALVCLALAPLNQLSNVNLLFDPAVYYATAGGPYTASIGALSITAALVLLGMFTVLRAHARSRSRWFALVIVLVVMGSTPFVLRLLSLGITPPMEGITATLWVAWEVALFLVAASLLLGAATAGASLLGPTRGVPPAVAPVLAAASALVATFVLEPPARWPAWYTALWIAVIGAVALTRRHRRFLLSIATVAALGATILAWRADVGARVTLATADVAGLTQERPEVTTTLARLGASLAVGAPLGTDAALLHAYAKSDLEGSGFPVWLAAWSASDGLLARLALAPATASASALAALRRAARASGHPQVSLLPGPLGAYHALAVPFADGTVAMVVVAPRSRLVRDDPYDLLLGVAPRESGEAPYAVSLAPADSAVDRPATAEPWSREGDELHGHRLVWTDHGLARAHIRIDLRPFDVLLQRGVLVVLLDLVLVFALWTLSASPDRPFWRWLRARRHGWKQSYRLRLTVALFAFFVVPAAASAGWSWNQLRQGNLQSREVLVREALRLRAVVPDDTAAPTAPLEVEMPLLAYRNGVLSRSTDPVLTLLAPTGRFLAPPVYERLALATEVDATELERVGSGRLLVGYRAQQPPDGASIVIAAPAPGSEATIDRGRRDLGVLVMFATVLGAIAALWLSGVAARSLAEPIGRLRAAALALAEGTLEPPLPPRPPAEFSPVFSAFRRMARDVRESRAALEEAERRTSAVLRNVASAVVAVDAEGHILLANPRAERLLGSTSAPRLPVGAVMPPDLAQRLTAFLRTTSSEQEFDISLDQRQLHGRLTRLASGRGGAVLTLDDVTELARAQRVLAWGEMARQVAHEIKNPLTPIRLGVQHLKRAHADQRPDFDTILERNVSRILSEIDRLDQIARGFSRYGTAPAERQPPEATDVAAVARDVVDLERLGRDTVDWHIEGAGIPAPALARDDELREVLLNILENARLASARHVHVGVLRHPEQVVVEVADDGHGIPAHLVPRIFEPHFSTRTSGSGLGLAISRQLIEGWGGEITVASTVGKGTVVRITLLTPRAATA